MRQGKQQFEEYGNYLKQQQMESAKLPRRGPLPASLKMGSKERKFPSQERGPVLNKIIQPN